MNGHIIHAGVVNIPAIPMHLFPHPPLSGLLVYSGRGRDPRIDKWFSDTDPKSYPSREIRKWIFWGMTARELSGVIYRYEENHDENDPEYRYAPLIEALMTVGGALSLSQIDALVCLTCDRGDIGVRDATKGRPAYFFVLPDHDFCVALLAIFRDVRGLWHSDLMVDCMDSSEVLSGSLYG